LFTKGNWKVTFPLEEIKNNNFNNKWWNIRIMI
jgi:hypothetical protein